MANLGGLDRQRSTALLLDDYCCRRRRPRVIVVRSPSKLTHHDHIGGSLVVQTPGTAAATPCDRNTDLLVANWASCRPSRPRAPCVLVGDHSAIAQPLVPPTVQPRPCPCQSIPYVRVQHHHHHHHHHRLSYPPLDTTISCNARCSLQALNCRTAQLPRHAPE